MNNLGGVGIVAPLQIAPERQYGAAVARAGNRQPLRAGRMTFSSNTPGQRGLIHSLPCLRKSSCPDCCICLFPSRSKDLRRHEAPVALVSVTSLSCSFRSFRDTRMFGRTPSFVQNRCHTISEQKFSPARPRRNVEHNHQSRRPTELTEIWSRRRPAFGRRTTCPRWRLTTMWLVFYLSISDLAI